MASVAAKAGRDSVAGIRPDQEAPLAARVTSEAATSKYPCIWFETPDYRLIEREDIDRDGVLQVYQEIELADGKDLMGGERWIRLVGDKASHHILLKLVWALRDELRKRI